MHLTGFDRGLESIDSLDQRMSRAQPKASAQGPKGYHASYYKLSWLCLCVKICNLKGEEQLRAHAMQH